MKEYQRVFPISKEQAEEIFASNDVERICETMISVAFYEQDWKWAQDKFLEFLLSKNIIISGLAATCLGHIARIHHQLQKKKVVAILRDHLTISEIEGQIQDALDDIEQFVL